MITIGLTLEPLDTLFFRSGRPFGAGLPGESGLPSPQNLAGALRTFLLERAGADFEAMRGKAPAAAFAAAGAPWLAGVRFRGPWLAEVSTSKSPRPFVPLPADLFAQGGRHLRMRPVTKDLPGWQPPEPAMKPLWLRDAKPDKGLRDCCRGKVSVPTWPVKQLQPDRCGRMRSFTASRSGPASP